MNTKDQNKLTPVKSQEYANEFAPLLVPYSHMDNANVKEQPFVEFQMASELFRIIRIAITDQSGRRSVAVRALRCPPSPQWHSLPSCPKFSTSQRFSRLSF